MYFYFPFLITPLHEKVKEEVDYLRNRREKLSNKSIQHLIDPLHKWRLNLNNNTHTSLASHSCENSFVLKHECEAKDVQSIVIQI